MLAVGTQAPPFAARDHDGNEIHLQDYLGKKDVVLYFFPKDATPG